MAEAGSGFLAADSNSDRLLPAVVLRDAQPSKRSCRPSIGLPSPAGTSRETAGFKKYPDREQPPSWAGAGQAAALVTWRAAGVGGVAWRSRCSLHLPEPLLDWGASPALILTRRGWTRRYHVPARAVEPRESFSSQAGDAQLRGAPFEWAASELRLRRPDGRRSSAMHATCTPPASSPASDSNRLVTDQAFFQSASAPKPPDSSTTPTDRQAAAQAGEHHG